MENWRQTPARHPLNLLQSNHTTTHSPTFVLRRRVFVRQTHITLRSFETSPTQDERWGVLVDRKFNATYITDYIYCLSRHFKGSNVGIHGFGSTGRCVRSFNFRVASPADTFIDRTFHYFVSTSVTSRGDAPVAACAVTLCCLAQ
jgi:hypothetical protein